MERILESRKAFAINRYIDGENFNIKALKRDAAALVIETSGNIHSFFLAVLPDGRVINPSISKTKDVESFYSEETPQTILEKEAGLKMKTALSKESNGTLCAWISPPGGEFDYEEGRFEIGRIRTLLGFKILQTYGIPLKNVTPEYCERLFLFLEEFSDKPSQNINSPEDLRDKISIFKSPNGSPWITFLSKIFPELSLVWNKIKEGEVSHLQLQALKDARQEVDNVLKKENISTENLIYLGAEIENGMEKRGWNLSGEKCGYLNREVLKIKNKGLFGIVAISEESEEWEYHIGNCKVCGGENLEVGPCDICKNCEKKFNNQDFSSPD